MAMPSRSNCRGLKSSSWMETCGQCKGLSLCLGMFATDEGMGESRRHQGWYVTKGGAWARREGDVFREKPPRETGRTFVERR